MAFKSGDSVKIITEGCKKAIGRKALHYMRVECDTDFEFLSEFRTHGVGRFLGWIRTVPKADRLEAALSLTYRNLKRRRISCETVPNFQYWTSLYSATPLDLGLDRTWRPRTYAKQLRTIMSGEAEWHSVSYQSFDLIADSPLAIPQIRTDLEINTRVADISLRQFLQGDNSLFDISYVSVLGIGATRWKTSDQADCEKVIKRLPIVIAKANELFE
jgi:hypothetical protein